ncbi:MAG: hypothetical protein II061_01660, partial [Bacteroidaceae bacterium]|nr:hypothetical protein [Bacteroidaceae bacterium]
EYVPIVARVRPQRFFAPFAWIKETGFGKMWQGTSNASESLPLTLIEIHFDKYVVTLKKNWIICFL